jgi:glycosyltransferase involved in cell wall biosynthesis
MQKQLKVAFIGNIANNFYREVRALRKYSDIEADLYMERTLNISTTMLPESDDPNLIKTGYPYWIKLLPKITCSKISLFHNKYKPPIKYKEVINKLNSYDICVCSSHETLLIPFLKTTSIFRVSGSDFTVFPSLSFDEFNTIRSIADDNNNILKYSLNLVKYYINRQKYRQAIYSSSYINVRPAIPYKKVLRKLNINEDKTIEIFPLTIDTQLFSKKTTSDRVIKNTWNLNKYKFIVFMPSRLMINSSQTNIDTGQWKASDQAIYAFKIFIDSLPQKEKDKVVMIIPDRSISDEIIEAKRLIQSEGLNGNILFIKGTKHDALTRHELIDLFSISDVVLDDFGAGWYGSIVVEAMSCSCPVITYVNKEIMHNTPWHPLQVAKTKKEISDLLKFLYKNPEKKQEIACKSRLWIEEFHSETSVSKNVSISLRQLKI